MRAVTVVAVAAVLGVASSAAAQGFPFPKSGGAFIPAPQESKPVISLTLKNREEALRKLQSLRGGAQPTVVCGMTIIPATPGVDPKSIKKAPTDKKYTMRTVPRAMCSQEASTVVVPPSTVAPR